MPNELWSELGYWKAPMPTVMEPVRQVSATARPTLVVGLGGTGCKLVQKLKHLVETSFATVPTGAFQFVSLDLDVQSPASQQLTLGPDVFKNLAQPQIAIKGFIRNMKDHQMFPELSAWWPHHPGRVDQGSDDVQKGDEPYQPLFSAIAAGAMAVRPIGRFGLWNQGSAVRQLLEAKWGAACNARLSASDIAASNTGKIYLICSLAGGTGSGMFLDAAYMLRSITESYQFSVFITGVLLMDSTPFANFAPNAAILDRMRANVYAALIELDHYMNKKPYGGERVYKFKYGKRLEIVSDEPPFDVCYLLGVVNEGGRQLRALEDISNMIAEAIYLEMASPMAEKGRSVLDNVENLGRYTKFPMADGQSKEARLAFSSLAVASLTYDRPWTVSFCAPRLTFNALRRLVGTQAQSSQAPVTPAAELLTKLGFTIKDILQEIKKGNEEVKKVLRELLAKPGLAIEDIQKCIEEHGQKTGLQVCQRKLQSWAKGRMLDPETGGLRILLRELSEVVAVLDLEAKAAGEQTGAAGEAGDEANKEIRRIQGEIDKAQQEGRRGRGRLPGLKTELASQQEKLRKHNDLKRQHDELQQVLKPLHEYCQTLSESLDTFIKEWDRYHRKVENEKLTKFIRGDTIFGGHPLSFHALTAQGLENLVRRFEDPTATTVGPRIADAVQQVVDQILSDPPSATLYSHCQALYRQVRAAVEQSPELREDDLFEIIRKCECGPEAEAHEGADHALRRLQLAAAPFWRPSVPLVEESGEVAAINLVGYETTDGTTSTGVAWQSRLPELLGQASPVAHGIPDRLILMQTRHGAPAYAVAASNPDLRRAYRLYLKMWREDVNAQPVHLTDGWCFGDMEDMDPRPSS